MACGACRRCTICDHKFHDLDVLQYLHDMCIQHVATLISDTAGNAVYTAAASGYAALIVSKLRIELDKVHGQEAHWFQSVWEHSSQKFLPIDECPTSSNSTTSIWYHESGDLTRLQAMYDNDPATICRLKAKVARDVAS